MPQITNRYETKGDTGNSAYEVAVANGFVGTEAAWLASLVGADGADGADGATGATGATGAAGADGADGADGSPGPVFIQVALSGNGQAIASGTKKGVAQIPFACNAASFKIVCDPANEPSASSVSVDCNKINLSTGAATTILSSVAAIATSANAGTGTINGTQSFAAGDLVSFDVDQGSDGKELIAILQLTPTP